MDERIAWAIKGTWIEACNCDFGCPCNFSGFPTKGFCQAVVGVNVHAGRHGSTSLDGTKVLTVAAWPGAIHEGNGSIAVFIDETASDDQRNALVRILTGQDGGMPWELLAATVTDIKGPFFAHVTFDEDGTKSKLSAPGVDVELEPFTNPVTGEVNEVHTVIPTGFIWRDGHVCKTSQNVAKVDGIDFDWTGQNAYYAPVEWSNAESPETVAGTRF